MVQKHYVYVVAGARLIDHMPKSYKGTAAEFVADTARLNGVENYISIWRPGESVIIPTVKGEK